MRKIYSLLIVTLVLASCGEKEQTLETILASKDVKEVRAKKAELDAKQKELSGQLKQLNDRIAELDPSQKIPLITTFKAKEEVFMHYLELQGNVKTKQNVLIYPEVGGLLEQIYVKEGQKVSKGDILARVDDAGMTQQLAQLETNAELAKTTYERQERLWNQKIGSEIEFLKSKTNYESLKNQVAQAKKQLGKYNISAPFSGVIDDVIKDEGTVVGPGQGSEIFRIVNLGNMYIETDVPETYIKDVTIGKDVDVDFPILGTSMKTKVRQAGNFINPSNRTFKIEVFVSNKDGNIKPNLTARLKINDYTNDKAILIPQSIVSENSKGQQYIYVIEGAKKVKDKMQGTAKQAIITTGKTQGDFIEVLSGISLGDEVVKAGARSVQAGQLVNVKEDK
ncbi:MAG: efflux RND transporter periplasmic adaptor subunit [Flavobacteriaceae bacterium]